MSWQIVLNNANQIVLAGTHELAKIVDELNLFPEALKISVDGAEAPRTGWMSFKDLVVDRQQRDITDALAMPPSDGGGTIMFTSGTTALPKGVYMSFEHHISRVLPGLLQGKQGAIRPGAVMCGVMPNNHAMGWAVLTMCLVSYLPRFPLIVLDFNMSWHFSQPIMDPFPLSEALTTFTVSYHESFID